MGVGVISSADGGNRKVRSCGKKSRGYNKHVGVKDVLKGGPLAQKKREVS